MAEVWAGEAMPVLPTITWRSLSFLEASLIIIISSQVMPPITKIMSSGLSNGDDCLNGNRIPDLGV